MRIGYLLPGHVERKSSELYVMHEVSLTQAIAAGIFALIGIQLFIAGLTLNVLAKMVRE